MHRPSVSQRSSAAADMRDDVIDGKVFPRERLAAAHTHSLFVCVPDYPSLLSREASSVVLTFK